MTLCNMAIEAGARAAMVAADETTLAYLKGCPFVPQGEQRDYAVAYRLAPGERYASTSNRNFKGRQGQGDCLAE